MGHILLKECWICNKSFKTKKEMEKHFETDEHKVKYKKHWGHSWEDLNK